MRALDIRGNFGARAAAERSADGRCDLQRMGREIALGLADGERPVFVWGVQQTGTALYASDMLNGIWNLRVPKHP